MATAKKSTKTKNNARPAPARASTAKNAKAPAKSTAKPLPKAPAAKAAKPAKAPVAKRAQPLKKPVPKQQAPRKQQIKPAAPLPVAAPAAPAAKKPIVTVWKSLLAVGVFVLFAFLLFVLSSKKAAPSSTVLFLSAQQNVVRHEYTAAIDKLDQAARALAERRQVLESGASSNKVESELTALRDQQRQVQELRRYAQLSHEESQAAAAVAD